MSAVIEKLDLEDLNLSSNAQKFIMNYTKLLNKPFQLSRLPDEYSQFACTSEHSTFYAIGIKPDVIDWEANLCHELFHAYQLSNDFPTVMGYAPDTNKFCENLRSTILDLSDNEALKANGIKYDNIVRFRYRELMRQRDASFNQINNQYAKDLFTIDLILDMSDFTKVQCENILPSVQRILPDVYNKYQEYHQVIFEQNDYHTADGCLHIFAYIFDDIGLWNQCVIKYKGEEIRTPQKFKRIIQSSVPK